MKRRRGQTPFSLFSFQDIITGLCGIVIFFVMVMLVDIVIRREVSDVTSVPDDEVPVADEDAASLRRDIAELRRELAVERERASKVIVSVNTAAAPEEAARFRRELDASEQDVAALVCQVEALRTRLAAARDADAKSREKVQEMEKTRRTLERRLADLADKKGVTLIPERGTAKSPIYLICGRGGVELVRPIRKNGDRRRFPLDGDMRQKLCSALGELDRTTYTVVVLVRPSGVPIMKSVVQMVKDLGFSYGRDPLEEDVELSFAGYGEDPS